MADGFFVDETGGRQVMDIIAGFRTELAERQGSLDTLTQPPMLGSSPGAEFLARHAQRVAAGDPRSLLTVLAQAEVALDHIELAVRDGMAAYQDTDRGAEQDITGARHDG